jgi:hypothetical protein
MSEEVHHPEPMPSSQVIQSRRRSAGAGVSFRRWARVVSQRRQDLSLIILSRSPLQQSFSRREQFIDSLS